MSAVQPFDLASVPEKCPKVDPELRRCLRPVHTDNGPCHFPDRMTRAERLAFERARYVARVDRLRRTPVASW